MFHEVAYTGNCEFKRQGHEYRGLISEQTVLTSLAGPHEGAYTGFCEYKLRAHEPRE